MGLAWLRAYGGAYHHRIPHPPLQMPVSGQLRKPTRVDEYTCFSHISKERTEHKQTGCEKV